MNHHGPTVVKRGGFFSAFAYGLFGTLTALIVCSAGVGLYAINVVDRKVETAIGVGTDVIQSLPKILPELRESLPPALADTLADARDPNYRSAVELETRLAKSADDDASKEVVINVRNKGDKTVSMMALRVVLVDEEGTPVKSMVTYAATPITVDQEWRGPILPGSLRRCGLIMYECPDDLTPQVEITDIRTWTGAEIETTPLTKNSEVVSQESLIAAK